MGNVSGFYAAVYPGEKTGFYSDIYADMTAGIDMVKLLRGFKKAFMQA